jgi:hypothetical protein
VKLADIGSVFAFREKRGIWHVAVRGRWGWGLGFGAALRDAMRLDSSSQVGAQR